MKTNENLALYVLRLAGTLFAIAAVVAALLACVNAVTAPVIDNLNKEKTQQAVSAVLPGGGDQVDFTDNSGIVKEVYKGEAGYAVKVAPNGFGGAVTMMVGVDFDGNVLGVSIISHAETPGLGAVAAATTPAGENFRGQFAGLNGTISVTKDGGQVEAITGATITSRAICAGVNAAVECAANMG